MPNQNNLIENELFTGLLKEDPAALRDLMKSYFPILCGYAAHYVKDASLAEDIVQEVFIKFWQYKGTFESFNNIKAFLYSLTKNGCLNMQRGQERENSKRLKIAAFDAAKEPPVDDLIVKMEYLAAINLFVQQLPQKMREVFMLSFEEGLSIEEISQRMNIAVKTVRNQKYKSLVLLRKQFGHMGIPLLLLISKVLK